MNSALRPPRWILRVGAALLALVLTRGARADDAAAAEALFEAGRAAMRQGDTRSACERFRESHRLDPAKGTQLNLAVCEKDLGRLVVAWRLLRSLDQSLEPSDERAELVRGLLSELDRRVPRVTFEATDTPPPELRVVLDGAAISGSGFGVPIPVDPGSHAVEVRWPNQPPTRFTVALTEGERRAIPIAPPRTVPAPDAAPPPRRTERSPATSPLRSWSFAAFGVGGAGLAVGAATGLLALQRKETQERLCDPSGCAPGGTDAAQSGARYATVSTASVIAGAALVGLGVTLLVVASPTKQARTSLEISGSLLTATTSF